MKIRQIRLILWSSAVLMSAAALMLIFWAAMSPQTQAIAAQPSSQSPQTASSLAQATVSADDLARVAHVQLRRVLHDPPPSAPAAPAAAKPTPPLDIRLAGTIYEPGHCKAMIQLPDGTVQLKGVGESAGNARITDIQQGSATVDYFGKSMVLTVPKAEGS